MRKHLHKFDQQVVVSAVSTRAQASSQIEMNGLTTNNQSANNNQSAVGLSRNETDADNQEFAGPVCVSIRALRFSL